MKKELKEDNWSLDPKIYYFVQGLFTLGIVLSLIGLLFIPSLTLLIFIYSLYIIGSLVGFLSCAVKFSNYRKNARAYIDIQNFNISMLEAEIDDLREQLKQKENEKHGTRRNR